jgi:ribosomal protein RSM22 (predicted rRNA methylase)
MQLPAHLREIIEDMTESSAALARAASAVSARYRREAGVGPLAIASAEEARAYLAARSPATFCAAADVFSRFALKPASILDIGAGPGTATLAALARWPEIREAALVEPNTHLRAAGADLLGRAHPEVKTVWRAEGIAAAGLPQADLVVSGYMLNELPGGVREAVRKMWQAARGALVIVEPGTPQGYQVILEARAALIEADAYIAAPCPHARACPLAGTEKWCHFSVRVERSRAHRRAKEGAVLAYEDEKFSYLVAVREKPAQIRARLIGRPRGTKVVEAQLCTVEGRAETVRVAKSDEDYKFFRKAEWGDSF